MMLFYSNQELKMTRVKVKYLVNLNIQQNKKKKHFTYCSSFQTPDHNMKIQTIDNIDNINIKSYRCAGKNEAMCKKSLEDGNVKRRKMKVENYKNNVCWLYFFTLTCWYL